MANVMRIIMRAVQWPGIKERSERKGLRLRWDALTEDGTLLVAATEHPLDDGAHILVSEHGIPADTLITSRHEGKAYDSFNAMPITKPAARGAKRVEAKAAFAALRATLREQKGETSFSGIIAA